MMDDIHQQDDTDDIENDDDSIGDISENEERALSDKEIMAKVVDLDKNVLQRLKQNDPTITIVSINLNYNNNKYLFSSIDWKEDGDCIANNTHLKMLQVYLGDERRNLSMRQQLQDFFSSVHRNHFIEEIEISSVHIDKEFGMFIIEGLQGHPSLTRLKMRRGMGSIGCVALGKVLNHRKSKLMDIRLSGCQIDDDSLKMLCSALAGNGTMKSLCLDSNYSITSIGWQALSTVLRHPNCSMTNLSLSSTSLNDEDVNILGSALSGSAVKDLNLSANKSISSRGWQTFLNQLPHTSVNCLNLYSNNINDNGLHALANISTLKSLNLADLKLSIPSGWQFFFRSLQTRGVQLKKLNISGNNIGNEGIVALGSLLSTSSNTMETLHMHRISRHHGWQTLFTTLQSFNLDLVELSLGNNNIDDEGLQLLVRLVSNMNSLKCLDLGGNRLITPTGWQALSDYFRSPSFELRELDLDENYINDESVITFTNVLEHNKTLKCLSLRECHDENDNLSITKRGWAAVSTLLRNESSIMDTYNSNHTLQILGRFFPPEEIGDDLSSLLDLNKNWDKVEIARQKILQTHFSTEDGATSKMQELLDMELEMLPAAIAWMGRSLPIDWKGTNVSGLSTMYNMTRRKPDLFDSTAHKKPGTSAKRKRDI